MSVPHPPFQEAGFFLYSLGLGRFRARSPHRMHVILMVGPQGSGKGTQSERLAQKLSIPHLSLGTMFRAEVASGSELGKRAAAYMERGEIVPSDVAGQVMVDRLSRPDAAQGVILDGYPRTAEQAEALDGIMASLGSGITDVVYLNISDDDAVRRISGRRVCANTACERIYHVESMPTTTTDGTCDACGAEVVQRADDTPDAIRRRLAIYHAETFPLLAMYGSRGLLREVDGAKGIEEVQGAILAALVGRL